jgi:hypothetical protein
MVNGTCGEAGIPGVCETVVGETQSGKGDSMSIQTDMALFRCETATRDNGELGERNAAPLAASLKGDHFDMMPRQDPYCQLTCWDGQNPVRLQVPMHLSSEQVAQRIELEVHRYVNPMRIREPYKGRWTGKLALKQELVIPEGIVIKAHITGRLNLMDVSEEQPVQDIRKQAALKWGMQYPLVMGMGGQEASEGSLKHGDWVELLQRSRGEPHPIRFKIDDGFQCKDVSIYSRVTKDQLVGLFQMLLEHHVNEYRCCWNTRPESAVIQITEIKGKPISQNGGQPMAGDLQGCAPITRDYGKIAGLDSGRQNSPWDRNPGAMDRDERCDRQGSGQCATDDCDGHMQTTRLR